MPINLSPLNRLTHKHSQADRQKTQDNNLKISNIIPYFVEGMKCYLLEISKI